MTIESRYLNFSKLAEKIDQSYGLSVTEIRLLNEILESYLDSRVMSVTGLLTLKEIASPASLHAALKKLIKKNMVTLSIDERDERIKRPTPSPLALTRLKKLNKLF